jgi:hypothetical protein
MESVVALDLLLFDCLHQVGRNVSVIGARHSTSNFTESAVACPQSDCVRAWP